MLNRKEQETLPSFAFFLFYFLFFFFGLLYFCCVDNRLKTHFGLKGSVLNYFFCSHPFEAKKSQKKTPLVCIIFALPFYSPSSSSSSPHFKKKQMGGGKIVFFS